MDSSNWIETGGGMFGPNTGLESIKDLDKRKVREGAQVVELKEEIPQGEDVIYLNSGHTPQIPLELVEPDELYFQKQVDYKGQVFYNVHASINLDRLTKSKLFQENDAVKDAVFFGLYQQLGQADRHARLKNIKYLLEMDKEKPGTPAIEKQLSHSLNTIESLLTSDYNQARAAQKLLNAVGNYQTREDWRNITKKNAEKILGQGPLEKQLEETRTEIQKAKEAA